ncbi:hypothetical protein BN134_3268 [Cronobacter dublinensis 1210]|uniref:Uncharacterized protein n=1 Tax=Cronobacter dublinensis 1210 TaxID=1208656 RepID=A0ABP1WBM6_9ENTR|nr:hypothetical protein BN134_3268 [Cronobacter dublinensis 1210]
MGRRGNAHQWPLFSGVMRDDFLRGIVKVIAIAWPALLFLKSE